MKEFAHPDTREQSPADLNHAIETTLVVAHNEYKYLAEVVLSSSLCRRSSAISASSIR